MKCAIVYFSGTGNTEFVARQFKQQFEKRAVECTLIDTSRKKSISDNYDVFVFGSPIHYEMFPRIFVDWIRKNIFIGNNRKCIIFSTQASDSAVGIEELARILGEKGFLVEIKVSINMPNNYYLSGYKKFTDEEAACMKVGAREKVEVFVNSFLEGKKELSNVSKRRVTLGKISYSLFTKKTGAWAKRNLDVDYDRCVRCGKCAKNCPVRNISIGEKISFDMKCMSCMKCVHKCPVNAFTYRGKHFEQYKV